MKHLTYLSLFLILAIAFSSCAKKDPMKTPVKVEVKQVDGRYQLYRDGKPFYILGAGCEFGDIRRLSEHGANSFRTWRTENGQQSGQAVLDSAYACGLTVLMGLEIARERHGFSYDDTAAVRKQFEYVKGEVMKYKDHPALLAWGIGNELNLRATNMKVYDAVNEIAKMIHEIDPNHPATTMTAGIGKTEVDYIKENCKEIDFLSIQMYGDIINLQTRIKDAGWEGPYMVTEWGATGHWEVGKTSWGAPIEQTSHEKAASFTERFTKAIAVDTTHCLGSYVFLWGQKQERTPTWYGMFTENNEEMETVEAMHKIWTGEWPANRCPQLDSFRLDGKNAFQSIELKAKKSYKALVGANDPDNDALTYRWEIMPESTDLKDGGDLESRPGPIAGLFTEPVGSELEFTTPETPGAYRIFVYVLDGKGHAATANIPFMVKK
ncbi:MAG: glycoside hydrolase family 2 TIM barrel-domain containing protein [Bacteroidales bacterium]